MSEIIDEELPLSLVTRLSPLNPRQDMTSDVSTLAATIRARGLLHPILVRAVAGEDCYAVLAGGRRWRALRSLGSEDRVVEVRIFTGSDAEAREAALAEAVTQKPLHPVEEFEAFSDLEKSGFDVPTIARDFALTERHVRQRLALGRLSPRVRDLWKAGEISRTLAEAFTAGTIEAQEAFLDGPPSQVWSAHSIRKALRREAVEAHEALSKFILAERGRRASYELMGGRIEDSLFSEETILLDRTIAQSFADGFLLAAAEEIAEAEGWGRAEIAGDADPDPAYSEPDYTKAEERRLDAIRAERRDCDDAERRAALDREEEEIDVRALLRAVPKKARAMLGVRAELDSEGRVEIVRAVPQVKPEEEPTREEEDEPRVSGAADRRASKPREAREPEPPAIPPAPGGKDAQAVLTDALGGALVVATARNLNLALSFAVAALGCSHGRIGVGLAREITIASPPRHALLQRLAPAHFLNGLAIVAQAPLADLSAAFAELIGRSLWLENLKPSQTQNFVSLAAGLVDLRADLWDALDYRALFEASSREDALDAIRAIDGEAAANEAGKLRKPKIVERAALLARDRHWLPEALASLSASRPRDERSTAQAMVEEIARDEEAKAAGQGSDGDGAPTIAQVVERFLEERCVRGGDGRIKAKALLDRFGEFAEAEGLRKIGYAELSEALGALGFEKKRSSDGVHYLGLALRDDAEARQAAERLP